MPLPSRANRSLTSSAICGYLRLTCALLIRTGVPFAGLHRTSAHTRPASLASNHLLRTCGCGTKHRVSAAAAAAAAGRETEWSSCPTPAHLLQHEADLLPRQPLVIVGVCRSKQRLCISQRTLLRTSSGQAAAYAAAAPGSDGVSNQHIPRMHLLCHSVCSVAPGGHPPGGSPLHRPAQRWCLQLGARGKAAVPLLPAMEGPREHAQPLWRSGTAALMHTLPRANAGPPAHLRCP